MRQWGAKRAPKKATPVRLRINSIGPRMMNQARARGLWRCFAARAAWRRGFLSSIQCIQLRQGVALPRKLAMFWTLSTDMQSDR
jgi:hypothetical protein